MVCMKICKFDLHFKWKETKAETIDAVVSVISLVN